MKLQRLSVAPVLLTLCVATLLILSCAGVADGANFPPPHCRSEAAESLPPRLRRICAALYGIAEISQAVEQYLDDKTMRDSMPLIDSGVKRQDVDHVFLRFGKR